jgi:glycosyltransferase involved in cell wall biosynthesis
VPARSLLPSGGAWFGLLRRERGPAGTRWAAGVPLGRLFPNRRGVAAAPPSTLAASPPASAPAAERPPAPAAAPSGRLRVVVVIPAYNEAATLPQVIAAARAVPEVDEVVVVSDGSTDATPEVARAHGALCIELEQNVGKGGAMKAGIDRADADVYVFLDADLIGVTPEHVRALLLPVLRGETEVTIAQLDGGRVATDLASVVAPNLSGQRAVTRRVLQGMSGLETTRFGVEIAMKRYIKRQGIPVVRVPLDISHRTKEEKLGLLRGFLARLKEYWEIVKTAGE